MCGQGPRGCRRVDRLRFDPWEQGCVRGRRAGYHSSARGMGSWAALCVRSYPYAGDADDESVVDCVPHRISRGPSLPSCRACTGCGADGDLWGSGAPASRGVLEGVRSDEAAEVGEGCQRHSPLSPPQVGGGACSPHPYGGVGWVSKFGAVVSTLPNQASSKAARRSTHARVRVAGFVCHRLQQRRRVCWCGWPGGRGSAAAHSQAQVRATQPVSFLSRLG